jgi:hypothetical protein
VRWRIKRIARKIKQTLASNCRGFLMRVFKTTRYFFMANHGPKARLNPQSLGRRL